MFTDPFHGLCHDIRGRLNGLKLCVDAIGIDAIDSDESMAFTEDVIRLCDVMDGLMQKLDLYENGSVSNTNPSRAADC